MQMSPWDFSKQIILVTQDGLIFETFYELVEMFLLERMPMQHYKGTSTGYLAARYTIHIKWQNLQILVLNVKKIGMRQMWLNYLLTSPVMTCDVISNY